LSNTAFPVPSFSPLYEQIKAMLLTSLQTSEWLPGEAIPSEMELAVRYSVSQGTVRKAIDELAAENLLVRRQVKAPSLPPIKKRTGNIVFYVSCQIQVRSFISKMSF